MRKSMDWTLEDNMADGLRFCATLTGRRGGHTPFVQAGAETSDTGVETVKVEAVKSLGPAAGPKLFLGGYSGGWVPGMKISGVRWPFW